MRKLSCLMAMLALCVLWGCSDDNVTSLSVGTDTLIFPYTGGTQTLTITCDSRWGISQLPEWLSVSVASGTGVTEVTLKVTVNPDKEDREAIIVVYTENGAQDIKMPVRQYGKHTCPIEIGNTNEKVFGGRALPFRNEKMSSLWRDTVTVKCDTEWQIEGPSWISAIYNSEEMDMTGNTHYTGSDIICFTANESYDGENARRDTVYLRTYSGESVAKIPVCQLGGYEIQCCNPLVTKDGFACLLKVGSQVEYVILFDSPTRQISSLTYDDFDEDWNKGYYYKAYQTNGNYAQIVYSEDFEMDKDYTMFFIGKNANKDYAPLSKVSQHKFHSMTEQGLRPAAEIKNVHIQNGICYWTVKPNDYTRYYQTNIYHKSEFGNMTPSEIGLSYAYRVYYVGLDTGFGDSEKTFSASSWLYYFNPEVTIVVAPFGGPVRKPTVVNVYTTNFSASTSAN